MDTFTHPITVYYEDTDAGGVVYHANYVKYFERARSEYVKDVGLSNQHILSQGYLLVVNKMEIAFKKPAKLEDKLAVSVLPVKIGRAKMVFQQQIRDSKTQTLLCEGLITIGVVDAITFRPKPMPDDMRLKFS